MPSVLIPKYPLGQITNNFFARSQGVSVNQFVLDNFINANGSISATNPHTSIQPTISNDLLNAIMVDYGNGPISKGLNSLAIINRNVIAGTQNTSDIFGNTISYGANINFKYVTNDTGRTIVLANLSMQQIINVIPLNMQTNYYQLIDNIVNDLKNGIYKMTNYSLSILRQSRNSAQAASRVVNNGTNI